MNTRQEIVDRHTILRHLPRRARDIAGQPGARGIRQAKLRDRRFHRLRGDIDHPSPPPINHLRHQRRHEGNGGEHIGIQRGNELVAPPIVPHAGRGPARIGHQDVDLARRFQQRRTPFLTRHIRRDSRHRDAMRRPDRLGRGLQGLGAPRIHHQITARRRQSLGTTAPQTFGRGANQCAFTRNSKIHDILQFCCPRPSRPPSRSPVRLDRSAAPA